MTLERKPPISECSLHEAHGVLVQCIAECERGEERTSLDRLLELTRKLQDQPLLPCFTSFALEPPLHSMQLWLSLLGVGFRGRSCSTLSLEEALLVLDQVLSGELPCLEKLMFTYGYSKAHAMVACYAGGCNFLRAWDLLHSSQASVIQSVVRACGARDHLVHVANRLHAGAPLVSLLPSPAPSDSHFGWPVEAMACSRSQCSDQVRAGVKRPRSPSAQFDSRSKSRAPMSP
eukprot:NODE_3724_length_928_cov_18.125142_g3424_i0.p1 GENE.NODE_3724_length_928_cov_18.125142_g3424_i0~~NODE_3724_length_928_cov_18.125142_g3424_i0.p1  ORF type:complete len:232 (+),score=14.16 NODE_3724_length_928_cov_18.125142_g3424_i0:72-767(+)